MKIVESMKDVDLSQIKLPMAVIYDHPKDFPEMYLCRIWEGAGCHPTDTMMFKDTPEKIREDLKVAGFSIRIPRAKDDDRCIVETWMK